MKCPRCQHENPPQAKFCPECGARVALTCTKCRSELPAGAKFCLECGEPVASQATAEPRFTSPESYTPKHLAEKILTSKNALEGERKQVTVLFADLKGSMELLADRDPEEARKILDPVLEHMMEAVHRFEGTVNQVMGDGIMALFGAPLAHEDHAVRACYAALRMQESVKRYAEGVFRRYGVPVEIRVGLNSGEVVVRAIGSDLHMDYTAVGQTTHLAARMEQMARPGTILLAPDTLALAEGFVQVTSRGPVPVKGLAAPIEIFELAGAHPVRSRLHAAAARGLTRFVGRDAELELLRRALGRAGQGQGQVVAIVGEPGVGKSRLVWEFTHSHRSQEWLVLEATSVSYGKATTYYPVIELLRRYFQIEARDDSRKVREKVTGKLLSLDRALEPTLPVFLSLLDVPVDDAEWAKLDPPQRRRRTLDGLKRLLVRESQIQPVLLVFEDLHWIDSETQALLDTLVESVPTTRMLLLVNYRPEYTHGWGSKTYYQQLRLDTLPIANAGELLGALLGTDPGLATLRCLLIERTQGNPFFLEETVQALVETNVLTGERGSYRLARSVDHLRIPATVQSILTARIDRLAPEDKRLLQAAAIIGKEVPFTLLHAIAEEPEEALQQGLLRLQAAEFLYEGSLFPDLEYTFKHALTHQVAYEGLLHDRRQYLHARIAEVIEQVYSDRLDEYVDRLAHHAMRGELWEKAVEYLRRTGNKASDRGANREAVNSFEQALDALTRVSESQGTYELGIDLRFDLRHCLIRLGEIRQILDIMLEAERLALALDDKRRLARAWAYLSNYWDNAGRHDEAVDRAHQALAIANAFGDLPLKVQSTFYLARANHHVGRFREAIDFALQNLATLEGPLARERMGLGGSAAVFTRSWLLQSLAEVGGFSQAVPHIEEMRRVVLSTEWLDDRIVGGIGLGEILLAQGNLDEALETDERGLEICKTLGFRVYSTNFLSGLGLGYVRSGRVSEGLPLLEEAVEQADSAGFVRRLPSCLFRLAEGYQCARRPGEAREVAQRALRTARDQSQRAVEAGVLHVLAEISAGDLPPATKEADDLYRQAIILAETLAMRPLVAHCHLGLGKLYRRTGKREQAQEHLTTATTMYREMGMTYWLEQAETEMKELE